MTMHKQELTLFGGWAEVRIPPPIVNGVVTHSVTLSVSISLDSPHINKPHSIQTYISTDGGESFPTSLLDVSVNGHAGGYPVWQPITLEKAIIRQQYDAVGNTHKIEDIETIDPTVEKRLSPFGGIRYVNSHWTDLVFDTWEHLGFVRFFEVWKKGTHAYIMSALAGSSRFKSPLSGMLGSNNGSQNEKHALRKQENGEWCLKNGMNLYRYRYIRKLPDGGIENIRRHAYQLREQRRKE